LDIDTVIVISKMAAGVYSKAENCEGEHGFRKVITGKKCYWCTYDTTKKIYYHEGACPTFLAREILNKEKIQMKLWKIVYVFLRGDLNDVQETMATAHVTYIPSPSEPTYKEAELILTSQLKLSGADTTSPHVIDVSFSENIGCSNV